MAKWIVQIHGLVEVDADTPEEAKKIADELVPSHGWAGRPQLIGRDCDEQGWPLNNVPVVNS